MKELLSRQIVRRLIAVALLLVLALVSIFVISKSATDPNHYAHTIASIDEKKAAELEDERITVEDRLMQLYEEEENF